MQFTVNVATAGTYNIQVLSANYYDRGIIGLTVNGAALGSNINQYAPALTYVAQDMGNATLVAGNNTFKFTVNSKDAASSGWKISVDYLNLTPRNEARIVYTDYHQWAAHGHHGCIEWCKRWLCRVVIFYGSGRVDPIYR